MNPITIWRFEDAPQYIRDLSTHGGDEDWIAIIPPHLANEYIGFLEEGTSFGCCRVSEQPHPRKPGFIVKIGAHA